MAFWLHHNMVDGIMLGTGARERNHMVRQEGIESKLK
jgi:hypothetical protein